MTEITESKQRTRDQLCGRKASQAPALVTCITECPVITLYTGSMRPQLHCGSVGDGPLRRFALPNPNPNPVHNTNPTSDSNPNLNPIPKP